MLEALIVVAGSWPIATMVVGIGIGLGIWYAVYRSTRVDPLAHQEAMAKIETTHREIMTKINRETPKVIEHQKPKFGDPQ